MLIELAAVAGAGIGCGGLWLSPVAAKRVQIAGLRQLCRKTRRLVLTYDDGPGAELTPRVLDALAAREAKASFFLLGRSVIEQEGIVQRIADEGHEIGCHSQKHLHAWKSLPWNVLRDIRDGYETLRPWVVPDGLFRPPHGKVTLPTWRALRSRGARAAWWTVDSGDTRALPPRPESVADAVAAAGGGVVLMHDFDRSRERGDFVLATTELLLDMAAREGLTVCRYGDLGPPSIGVAGQMGAAGSPAAHERHDVDHHSRA